MNLLILLSVSYLIGAIPFSFLIGYFCGKIDLRKEGSGNVGATNLYRLCGLKYAFAGFACDFLKGFTAVFIAEYFFGGKDYYLVLSGIAVILGHVFPVYLKFKGGKGVSTTAGVLFLLDYRVFLIGLFVFVVVFLITEIVSLSSVISAFSLIVAGILFYVYLEFSRPKAIFFILVGVLIIVFHRKNIVRLFKKEEKKIV